MLLKGGVGEDFLRVPWTARRSNQSILKKSVLGVHWKDWCWSWNSNTLSTSCEELTHWKRPCCWEGLGAGGEGDDRGWDGWMESPTRCTFVWVNSGSWWWTGRPGMLRLMGWQRVGHDWPTELNWIIIFITSTIVWPQGNSREHSSNHQPKIGLKIYWANYWFDEPAHQNKAQFPP